MPARLTGLRIVVVLLAALRAEHLPDSRPTWVVGGSSQMAKSQTACSVSSTSPLLTDLREVARPRAAAPILFVFIASTPNAWAHVKRKIAAENRSHANWGTWNSGTGYEFLLL